MQFSNQYVISQTSFYLLVINKCLLLLINKPDKLIINSPSELQNFTCGKGLLSNKFVANGRLQELHGGITFLTPRRK